MSFYNKIVKLIFFNLLALFFVHSGYSQINNDGKITSKEFTNTPKSFKNSLIYSAGITRAPIGIRYQYLRKTIGVYSTLKLYIIPERAVKYDPLIGVGPVIKVTRLINLYLGGSVLTDDFVDLGAEAGIIFKKKRLAIDLGGGFINSDSDEYAGEYLTIGFGLNF